MESRLGLKTYGGDIGINSDRVMIGVLGIFFVSLISVIFIFVFIFFSNTLENQRKILLESTMDALVSGIERVSFAGRYHSKLFFDEVQQKNKNILFVAMYDKSGSLVTSSEAEGMEEYLSSIPSESLYGLTKEKYIILNRSFKLGNEEIEDREVFAALSAGYKDSEKNYILRVGITVDSVNESFLKGVTYFGILIFALLLGGVLVILFITRYFSLPIKRLASELKGILENAPFAMYFIDENGNIKKGSKSFYEMFNLLETQKEPNIYILLRGEFLEHSKRDDPAIFYSGITVSREILLDDGRELFVIKFPVLKSNNPEFNTIGAICIDIGEMKKREKEIALWKDRYGFAIDATNDGIWDWSIKEKSVFFSNRYIEMFGYKKGEIEEKYETWEALLHPEDKRAAIDVVKSSIEKKVKRFEMDFRLRCKDGSYKWISNRGNLLYDEKGELYRLVGSHSDITERKEADRKIRESQQELNELNALLEARVAQEVSKNREKDELMIKQARFAAMGETVGNIAHHWRQPLTVISGMLMNLEDVNNSDEITKESLAAYITKTNELVLKMSKMIDDFRNFFKSAEKKEYFNISDVVTKCISFIETSIKQGTITINFEVNNNINVSGYPSEYAQSVLNILTNCRDIFIERGIEFPKIDISAKMEGSKSILSIKDNGGGIDEGIIEHIFEPYVSTKDRLNGTGIGLYMTKIMIEKNMGGKAYAKNIENGAEFIIEL